MQALIPGVVIVAVVLIALSIRVFPQHERGVVFRLGSRARGRGAPAS